MPRYFFHVPGENAQVDDVGTDLSGPDEVRAEAVRMAGEILSHEETSLSSGRAWSMVVTNDAGETVYALRFEGRMMGEFAADADDL